MHFVFKCNLHIGMEPVLDLSVTFRILHWHHNLAQDKNPKQTNQTFNVKKTNNIAVVT